MSAHILHLRFFGLSFRSIEDVRRLFVVAVYPLSIQLKSETTLVVRIWRCLPMSARMVFDFHSDSIFFSYFLFCRWKGEAVKVVFRARSRTSRKKIIRRENKNEIELKTKAMDVKIYRARIAKSTISKAMTEEKNKNERKKCPKINDNEHENRITNPSNWYISFDWMNYCARRNQLLVRSM